MDQIFDIAAPFAQRRKIQIHNVDAVIQILAEGAIFNFGLEMPVGGADNADFHFLVFLCADAAELSILQELQQLRLQSQIEFGNFVEEQRSAVRQFNSSWLGAICACEGALLVSE